MKEIDCHLGLDQYTGRLNAAQIAAGMNAAEENAARLLADAELLLNAGRYPTACSLATLSLEEAGKIWTLRRIATCNDDAERRAIWTQYRSHQTKGRHSIIRKVFARHACLFVQRTSCLQGALHDRSADLADQCTGAADHHLSRRSGTAGKRAAYCESVMLFFKLMSQCRLRVAL